MKNSFVKVQLAGLKRIRVLVFSDVTRPSNMTFNMFEEGKKAIKLSLIKSTATASLVIFELALEKEIEFGHYYSVVVADFPAQVLDVSDAVNFPEFDSMFNYPGDDLGAIYYPDHTDFNIWAPLASGVYLKLEQKDNEFTYIPLKRTDYGVYRISINGDLLNRRYSYVINNSGVVNETCDPWGKGTSLNTEYSAVVDTEAIKNMPKIKPTTVINNPVDSIIYEVGVRDFTEEKDTDVVNKGKYLGMVEKGRKTKGGHPAGLDYLKYLGVTHVQLNPIIDFRGVKDDDPLKTYNWGYDPITFFGVEGSYSTKPEIPMERLKELRYMIDELHRNDIRVIMDVVYNHIYGYMDSCFEKVLPGYFFRRTKSGHIANASGCGNDFASERYMGRRAIIESIRYFVETFDVDGFRYDLMGLIDIMTINRCAQITKALKPDAIIYGEGWNMGYELPFEEKACSENARKMPLVGFFNPMFRDIIKGSTFNLNEKGYASGNTDCSTGMEFLITGSILPFTFSPLYLTANQSINYVECHDNGTLFDKYLECCNDEDEQTILKRIDFTNSLTLLFNGVSFIHMGQEVGLTKHGHDNTYNVVKENNMDWNVVDERFDMVNHVKETIRLRKNSPFTKLYKGEDINECLKFNQHYDEKTLYITLDDSKTIGDAEYVIILNPNNGDIPFEFKEDYYLIYQDGSYPLEREFQFTRGLLPRLSVSIFGKERKEND